MSDGEMCLMRILLVDDHVEIREEIAGLIEERADLSVAGQAGDGQEGVSLALRLKPDVVVMDVVMPGMNGVQATEMIHASEPDIRILALSNHSSAHLVTLLLRAGATGFVRKDHAYEELIPAIHTVAAGRTFLGADSTS